MYQHDHTGLMMAAIFVPAGLIMAVAGMWLKRKFRDPNEGKPGFRGWGVTPRGALEIAGAGLIWFGLFFAGFGVLFPFILR